MGLWWPQNSRWKPKFFRLGQLIFCPLGFMHIDINYMFLMAIKRPELQKMAGNPFFSLSARDCRVAKDLEFMDMCCVILCT